MSKKEIITTLIIILIIFCLGLILRVESTHLYGIPDNEKAFYQDQNGVPYMYDMDSYYNYRLTSNYLDHGYMGDKIINGTEWDLHSYYPPGVPLDYTPLLIYITAFIYQIVNLFAKIPLMVVCFWVPAFIAPFAGVVTFLFVRRYTNIYGATAAGLLAVTAPFYFMRTVPGFFDTDMFNIIFPILVVWFYFEALLCRRPNKQLFLIFLSATFMFLFALAWNGWQYLFYVIIVSSLLWIILSKLRGRKIKEFLKIFLIFCIVSLLLIGIFTGFLNDLKLLLGPSEIVNLFSSQGIWTPWPSVYALISELQPPSIGDLVAGMGPVLFILGIFGILVLSIKLRKENIFKGVSDNKGWFIYLFLIIWTLTALVALIKGIRFILLLIPPLTIILGILVGIATDFLDSLNKKNLKVVISILIIILILIPSLVVIVDNFSNLNPRMNDDLWNAGTWINNHTSQDTVVISSWVYGHFFTAIADRPVVFDGRLGYIETLSIRDFNSAYTFKDKSPTTAREYWIDKAYTTDNESLSAGIFRMLATTGDYGYLTLDEYTGNTTKTVEILNNILGVDKQTALALMTSQYGLSVQDAQNIVKFTHPDNPVPYVLVTYDEMIDTGYWIFNFGDWNFDLMKGGNHIYSYGNIKIDKENLKTDDGVFIDFKDGSVTWNGKTPYCLINVTDGNIEKVYQDNSSDFCVILLMDENKSVVIDKSYENSLFTNLVIEKISTNYFKPIYQNENVIVWKSS